jgi:hypothetical protein
MFYYSKTSRWRCSKNGRQGTIDFLSKAQKLVNKNFFLVGMFVAVALAKLFSSVSKKTVMAIEEIRCKFSRLGWIKAFYDQRFSSGIMELD